MGGSGKRADWQFDSLTQATVFIIRRKILILPVSSGTFLLVFRETRCRNDDAMQAVGPLPGFRRIDIPYA
jgi:hypothetical protein